MYINMFCCACLYTLPKDVDNNHKNTIWEFDPFVYTSYHDMKDAFYLFFSNDHHSYDDGFHLTHNEDGYTYTQWYIYYLCKNYHRYHNLKRPVKWLLYILADYPFFRSLLRYGSREDPSHHTLHHFAKYMDRLTHHHTSIINLLTKEGLSLSDEDNQGFTGHDYLSQKILSKEDLEAAASFTRLYKGNERCFFSLMGDALKRCEKCNDPISPYDDLECYTKTHHHFINENRCLVETIVTDREKCCAIYQTYQCDESCKRHLYVIDKYKALLSGCEQSGCEQSGCE
jgi:hypothetical protein